MANTLNLKHDVDVCAKAENEDEVCQRLNNTTFPVTHMDRRPRHQTRPQSYPLRSKSLD
jgi:hypothetical protein